MNFFFVGKSSHSKCHQYEGTSKACGKMALIDTYFDVKSFETFTQEGFSKDPFKNEHYEKAMHGFQIIFAQKSTSNIISQFF